MRSNVRTGWIAVGGALTVLAVLGVALVVWIGVTRVGVSQETTRGCTRSRRLRSWWTRPGASTSRSSPVRRSSWS
ncbi:hypothetical protein ACFQX6_59950 [Streptosporangium lutulentum]